MPPDKSNGELTGHGEPPERGSSDHLNTAREPQAQGLSLAEMRARCAVIRQWIDAGRSCDRHLEVVHDVMFEWKADIERRIARSKLIFELVDCEHDYGELSDEVGLWCAVVDALRHAVEPAP